MVSDVLCSMRDCVQLKLSEVAPKESDTYVCENELFYFQIQVANVSRLYHIISVP